MLLVYLVNGEVKTFFSKDGDDVCGSKHSAAEQFFNNLEAENTVDEEPGTAAFIKLFEESKKQKEDGTSNEQQCAITFASGGEEMFGSQESWQKGDER